MVCMAKKANSTVVVMGPDSKQVDILVKNKLQPVSPRLFNWNTPGIYAWNDITPWNLADINLDASLQYLQNRRTGLIRTDWVEELDLGYKSGSIFAGLVVTRYLLPNGTMAWVIADGIHRYMMLLKNGVISVIGVYQFTYTHPCEAVDIAGQFNSLHGHGDTPDDKLAKACRSYLEFEKAGIPLPSVKEFGRQRAVNGDTLQDMINRAKIKKVLVDKNVDIGAIKDETTFDHLAKINRQSEEAAVKLGNLTATTAVTAAATVMMVEATAMAVAPTVAAAATVAAVQAAVAVVPRAVVEAAVAVVAVVAAIKGRSPGCLAGSARSGKPYPCCNKYKGCRSPWRWPQWSTHLWPWLSAKSLGAGPRPLHQQ
jgi:hypothetical protein